MTKAEIEQKIEELEALLKSTPYDEELTPKILKDLRELKQKLEDYEIL